MAELTRNIFPLTHQLNHTRVCACEHVRHAENLPMARRLCRPWPRRPTPPTATAHDHRSQGVKPHPRVVSGGREPTVGPLVPPGLWAASVLHCLRQVETHLWTHSPSSTFKASGTLSPRTCFLHRLRPLPGRPPASLSVDPSDNTALLDNPDSLLCRGP